MTGERRGRRAGRRRSGRPRLALGALLDNPVVDAVGDLLFLAMLFGLYAGLTALYRSQPLVALAVMATVAVTVAAGLLSLALRGRGPVPKVERLAQGWAFGVVLLLATAAMVVLPVLLADYIIGWLL